MEMFSGLVGILSEITPITSRPIGVTKFNVHERAMLSLVFGSQAF